MEELPAMPQVHWKEGMLVMPHHFQACVQQINRTIEGVEQRAGPMRWGVRKLNIENVGGQIRVIAADVILPSGVRVQIPEAARIEARGYKFESGRDRISVRISVPVPGAGQSAEGTRYLIQKDSLEDENNGGNRRDIERRYLNARLFFGDERTDGYEEAVEIAQIVRAPSAALEGTLAEDFVAATPEFSASSRLRGLVERIVDRIRATRDDIAELLAGRSADAKIEGNAHAQLFWKLQTLNAEHVVIREMCVVGGIHPFDLYLVLRRLAGSLAVFDPEETNKRRGREVKMYDHQNLLGCYQSVCDEIERLLRFIPPPIARVPFVKGGLGLECQFNSAWLNREQFIHLSVEAKSERGTEMLPEFREQFPSHIKLAAEKDAGDVRDNALAGIDLTIENRTEGLPPLMGRGYYFEVKTIGDNNTDDHQRRLIDSLSQAKKLVLVVDGNGISPADLEFVLYATRY